MAEQKKIDVVIPAYKPGEKFQKLIKMLQKQTYPIHEILITVSYTHLRAHETD